MTKLTPEINTHQSAIINPLRILPDLRHRLAWALRASSLSPSACPALSADCFICWLLRQTSGQAESDDVVGVVGQDEVAVRDTAVARVGAPVTATDAAVGAV